MTHFLGLSVYNVGMADADPQFSEVSTKGNGALSGEVLRRVVARDPVALGQFFDAFADRVFGLAYRLLGDRTLAEDVSQEVFLKIHRAIHTLDPNRDPGPWVTTITYNACREHWRGTTRRRENVTSPLDEIEDWQNDHPTTTETPEGLLLADERDADVQRALNKLPDTLREVVVLHLWQGLNHKEIAEMLDSTHAAIRKRYSRALSQLAEILGS